MLFKNWEGEIWNDNGVDVSWESERGVYLEKVLEMWFFFI